MLMAMQYFCAIWRARGRQLVKSAVRFHQVTKRFGPQAAVKEVTLELTAGESVPYAGD